MTQFANRGIPKVQPFTVDDFYRALEVMSACPTRAPLPVGDHQASALIASIRALQACWQEELGSVEDLSVQMEAVLTEPQVRRELAEVLFECGEPTLSRLQMTCNWLFGVALTLQNLNQQMTEKLHPKQATRQVVCA